MSKAPNFWTGDLVSDILVFRRCHVSDGIIEAENAKEFYGMERLCNVVSAHWAKGAEAAKQQ